MRNFYQVLGVAYYALNDDIRAAYSEKMKDASLSVAQKEEFQLAAKVLLSTQSRHDHDVYLKAHALAQKRAYKDALRHIWHFIKKRDDVFWQISAAYHWDSNEFSQPDGLLRFHAKNKNYNSWHFLANHHVSQGKTHCDKRRWQEALFEYQYAAVALENKKEKSRQDLEWMVEILSEITNLHYACNDNEEGPHPKRDEYVKMLKDLDQQEESKRLKFRSVMFAQKKILNAVLPSDSKHEVKAAEKVPAVESQPMRIFISPPPVKVPVIQESNKPSAVIQNTIVLPPPRYSSASPILASATQSVAPVVQTAENSVPRHSVTRRAVAIVYQTQVPGVSSPDMKSPGTPKPGKSCVIC